MAAKRAHPRSTYHHGDLKNALVEAAIAIIQEHGAEAFTLREAARRAGVNHRAVYRHFEDRTALLAKVAEEGYRELVARMHKAAEQLGDDVDTRRQFVALAQAYVTFALAHPAHYRVMFGPRLNADGRFPDLELIVREAFELLMTAIQRGTARGELRSDLGRDAAISIWSAIHGLSSLILMRRVPVKRAELQSYTERVLAPTLAGLSAP
jgi:AcrR family transcriptional regulator